MFTTVTLVILGLLLLIAAGLIAWLAARSSTDRQAVGHARADADRVAAERDDVRTQRDKLTEENRDLTSQLDRLQERHDQTLQQHERAQAAARETFTNLANDTLEKVSQEMLKRADRAMGQHKQLAEKDLETRKQSIESMLRPIRETLDKHQAAVGQIEKNREGAYHALRQQITGLTEDQHRLRAETNNLVTALRRPEVRGRWGEVQLKRVAELAGMIEHCDFTEQQTVQGESSALRPDMLVHLPAGRTIVVDAKTPITAYIESIECDDDESRQACLKRHVKHIQDQVKQLSAKDYQKQFERSPDFVVLFIPGESFLQAAVHIEPGLIEDAMARRVVIATPTTLVSLLRAVHLGWREQAASENARQVQALGQELHERIAKFAEYLASLGKHLDRATDAYNKSVGSLESRVLVTTRKFQELQAASDKELPPPQPIQVQPRELQAIETDDAS
jgi:DNA recombination protein RmuC